MSLAASTPSLHTVEEYFALEEKSELRHEYRRGEILAMAGGTPQHSAIMVNMIAAIHGHLRGKPCRLYDSNLMVRLAHRQLYTYPDMTIVCGQAQFDPENNATLLNPRVVIEVLSPSTESYCRGEKFDYYRAMESLQEYVLVSQDSPRIESFVRRDQNWLFLPTTGVESTHHLASVEIDLPLKEVFEGIEFPPARTSEIKP